MWKRPGKEINKGLPELKDKMGVSISPANPDVVYLAIKIKGKEGGIYKSTDGGNSFKQTSNNPNTCARAWYYMHIFADPNDENLVYVFNSIAVKSIDTDNQYSYPYHVYSSQQDKNAIVIDSVSLGRGMGEHHWESLGVGESAIIGFDPDNPKYVYTTAFASMVGE